MSINPCACDGRCQKHPKKGCPAEATELHQPQPGLGKRGLIELCLWCSRLYPFHEIGLRMAVDEPGE